jgi:pyruvate/2-oxoacid:ferredoxin oxidoreductase beta subunit
VRAWNYSPSYHGSVDELGICADTIGVASVGCSVLAYDFMNIDMTSAAHGRAPAVATGIKRCWPDKYVLPIRAMATLQLLELPKLFMHATGEKILPSSLSIMVYTG